LAEKVAQASSLYKEKGNNTFFRTKKNMSNIFSKKPFRANKQRKKISRLEACATDTYTLNMEQSIKPLKVNPPPE